jgi:tetratricopeptide (TPR) repeat protein
LDPEPRLAEKGSCAIILPAMKLLYSPLLLLAFVVIWVSSPAVQSAALAPQAPASPVANPMAQGQKLTSEGKLDDAIAFYKNALESNPKAWDAYLGIGAALDLKGDYAEARQNLQKAIDLAPSDRKGRALRTMAVSYAFSRNANEAAKYEEQAFQMQLSANDFDGAAGVADELARIYLENGDLKNAQKWYKKGHETAMRNPKLTDAEKDLWAFRLESAQARIAARRGNKSEAQKHAAAAKAIIDKGTNPEQAQFVPYIEGYVAFYGGDYQAATADLQKANQKDPFILVLLAQAYEKSGNQKEAMEDYRKILQIYSHNPTNAFARPLAEKKVGKAE